MIQINELRIGNYVYYNNEHKEVGVITKIITEIIPQVDYVGINHRNEIHYQSKHINAIPLNVTWLKNFGYKKENNDFYNLGHIVWNYDYNHLVCNKNGITLKYVHQLQNLYFALTGKELTLKKQ